VEQQVQADVMKCLRKTIPCGDPDYASWNAKVLSVKITLRADVVLRKFRFVFSFYSAPITATICSRANYYILQRPMRAIIASMRQSTVTSLRCGCHALLLHCVQFYLEFRNLLKWPLPLTFWTQNK